MIRVLFLSSAAYSVPLARGTRNKFSLLSKQFVIFVIGHGTGPQSQTAHDAVDLYCTPYRRSWIMRRLLFCWYARIWLKKLVTRGIDVIVAQGPLEAAFISLVLPRSLRPTVIVELHGEWYRAPLLYKNIRSRFIASSMQWVNERGLKTADAFRVVSGFLEQELRRRHAVGNRPVYRFPAYTDFDLFLGITPRFEHNTVLFVGQLTYLKGIHYLLRACARVRKILPELECILVGDGDYKYELQKLAHELSISSHVHFRGHCPQEIVKQELERALVLVLPSVSEGLGCVLLEAQAAGIPVIGSAVGGIPEIIKNGETGFVIPLKDPNTLAEKLVYLAQNHDVAQVMGATGREYIQKSFSIEQYIKKYTTMIAEVCAE